MANQYSAAWREKHKEAKPEGICSTCDRPRDDPAFKKCSTCREYMRNYKAVSRAQPKTEGACSVADCPRQAVDGFKLCPVCRERYRLESLTPQAKGRSTAWRQALKTEVLFAYGGTCACCGTAHEVFLSIDHVDGYKDGPRGGPALYSWIKQHDYPAGFRVLCFSCNAALGYLGYCGHSNLTQVRVRNGVVVVGVQRHNQNLKQAAFAAYGGAACVCCAESLLECLTLDHIDGTGAAERATDPKARNLYTWLRQRGYPPGFRVFCFNCNLATHFLGYCPHQPR